jgi:hypothetical protein
MRSNFAYLIDSGIDKNFVADSMFRKQLVEDNMVDEEPLVTLDTSLEEYGDILRRELTEFLTNSLEVPSIKWPLELRYFVAKEGIDPNSATKIPQSTYTIDTLLKDPPLRKRDTKC